MSSDTSNAVEWDGDDLLGWIEIDRVPTKVRVTREIIHSLAAGFSDAVSWEIERHRVEIFEKLKQLLIRSHRGR